MTFKRILPIICLAICLFAMASVCASDANDTVMTSENSLEIDQTTKEVIAVEDDTEMTSSEEDVLTADELSFSQLNQTINRNDDGIVYLNSDYKYSDGDDSFKEGIVINRDVTIYGNGHIINGSKQSRIFQVTGGDVVFYNITFTNGQCDVFGGAISGKCEAINCIFNENFAKLSGGAIHKGYAVNCTFSGNTVDKFGGAMREGYAVNCTFSGNTAGNGGAMINSFAVNCTFIGNSAGTVGGAMEYGSAVNCTFINNTAYRGGCIYEGSAVNCTFINNTASQGGAMFAGYKWGCIAQNSNYQGTANLMLKWDVNNFTSEYGSATLPMLLRNQNKDLICFINCDVVVYKNDVIVRTYHCLSNEELSFDLAVGNYTAKLIVTYPGLNQPEPKNIKVTINKVAPNIYVSADDVMYPNDVVVSVKSDVGGSYVVKVGDNSEIVILVAGEAKNVTFTGLAANENGYVVNVTNKDVENLTSAVNDTVKVVVHKATPNIEVSADDATYPDDVVVSVKSDVGGEYIVKLGDRAETVILIAGEAKNVTFAGLVANESGYNVNVTYGATENYTDAFNDSKTVRVKKGTVKITAPEVTSVYNINNNLVITLKDGNDKPLSGINVTVDFSGTKNYTTDGNGQVIIPTKGLAVNTYKVSITFNGADDYVNSSNATTVTILKEAVKISTKPLTTTYNVHKYLVIALKDNNGNPIRNVDASFTINGVTYKCRSDNKGDARLIIRLAPKTYTAKITFDNSNYSHLVQYVQVTVLKATPKLTAKKKTFKVKTKVKKYTVTLKDNTGKAIKKAKLTIKIGKKTYKAKTNSKGKVVFKIKKLTKKGKYKAVIKFKGNNYYKKATKKVKITIK